MSSLEATLRKVYGHKTLSEALRITDGAIVFLTAYALGYLMCTLVPQAPLYALAVLGIMVIPFLLTSLLRIFVAAKRPYELFPFYEVKPRRKTGRSFPSRHAYSVFVIGTVYLWFSIPVGSALLLLGIALSLVRVLRGIHFPRDVIAGGIIGILGGVLGMTLLSLIL